jgi:ABC-type sugar transport system permease subunit
MSTITKSAFGSPGRSGMSAALVTLASVMALALVVLALSATRAQSTERHGTTLPQ